MLKCCFNPKVLIGLGVTAVILFFLVPGARGFLPVLLTLACPLSMVAMMGGMAKLGTKKTVPTSRLEGDITAIDVAPASELQELRKRVAELEDRNSGPDAAGDRRLHSYDVEA